MRTIVYSIDTIPDLDFGKKHMNLEGLNDSDIGRSMFFQQLQKQGDELLPIDLQKIVSISCIVDHNGRNELYTYTKLESFIDSIKDADYFITWNGKQFDFPVLYFRSLVERIVINGKMFDENHNTDLKELLSSGDINSNTGMLNRVSKHLGLPDKKIDSANAVWDLYLDDKIDDIFRSCESDVITIYLIYLHHHLSIGVINEDELKIKKETLKSFLSSQNNPHTDFIKIL